MAQVTFTNGDALSAAALAGLGVYVVTQASGWDYASPEGPGPGFFPFWYGIALIAVSLVVIGARVWRIAQGEGRGEKLSAKSRREIANALTVWLAFAVCLALLEVLGFLLAFALLTGFIVGVVYARRWTTALATAVLSAAGFWLVFEVALSVGLPRGALGF